MTTIYERARNEMRPEAELETIQDLAARLVALEETKRDYVVDTRRMSFTTTDDGISDLAFDVPAAGGVLVDGTDGGKVREHAHRQIRERLGIPARYYDRMRQDSPALLDTNVNHWLRKQPERRMVRMVEGEVRAFLSDRYRRLDNIDLMTHAVLPLLQNPEYGDLRYHVAVLSDDRLYIRALLPETRAIQVGDEVQRGIEIRNSEVGAGALVVAPWVWRLACKNGLVVRDKGLTRYHVGRQQEEEAYALYRDDTLAADDAAFFLKVRDAAAAALSDAMFDQITADMIATTTGQRIENPVLTTQALQQKFGLDDTEGARVLRALAEGGDFSRWGAVNALTAAAKDADTFARQHEMEAIGGVLVASTEQEWAALATA